MKFYQITGTARETFHVSTLEEARKEVRREEPAFRESIEVQEVEITLDKANILRLLDCRGGTHIFTGRTWRGTCRGGLKETTVTPDSKEGC